MNDAPLAHSARPERGIPAQGLWEHVQNVAAAAAQFAAAAAGRFSITDAAAFRATVEAAGVVHDCGKLAPENQRVLAGGAAGALPVKHHDAGAAWLLEAGCLPAAVLVASHHGGLPSEQEEQRKAVLSFPTPGGRRTGAPYRETGALDHTARHLDSFKLAFQAAGFDLRRCGAPAPGPLTLRLALSCLVDADHSDTARHYGAPRPAAVSAPRWEDRLACLDAYVSHLGSQAADEPRATERRHVYETCRAAPLEPRLRTCEAPVGSGKTTAVMAHLLRVAAARGLRHVFVVLPWTNIIRQSVEVYREALTLPGEDPEQAVAELHHQADFENPDSRAMAALWTAPVIVTTAVQFFETLAANRPAPLRKLHELPGSAVFLDEAHGALPVALWRQTWAWLKELAAAWGCHFVFGSGSLSRFWELARLMGEIEPLADLLPSQVATELHRAERTRILTRCAPQPLDLPGLAGLVMELPGPRLVVLNTVQSAAVLARHLREGNQDVLHLSTALTPRDRARIVKRIRSRLADEADAGWALVATSCVEAGLDFSFRSGVRERCSLASLVQTGGRVNRRSRWPDAELWDVTLCDPLFNEHPSFRDSRRVLEEMLAEGLDAWPSPADAATEALRRELIVGGVAAKADELLRAERLRNFPSVAQLYRVIEADTHLVVVDPGLVQDLERGRACCPRDLLLASVQLWSRQIERLALRPLHRHPEIYRWDAPYEPEFLGYMAGVLPLLDAAHGGALVI
jgi:CRISPR-associated endonuclease/helicase Cas3